MSVGRSLIMLGFTIALAVVGTSAHAAPGNQETCPVMGFEISRDIFTDYQAKRIYFCCPSCPLDFNRTPDYYMKKMIESGVILEDSPA